MNDQTETNPEIIPDMIQEPKTKKIDEFYQEMISISDKIEGCKNDNEIGNYLDQLQKVESEYIEEINKMKTVSDFYRSYSNRSVALPIDRKSPRHVDRFPNHQLGNYKVYNPEEAMPQTIDAEGIKKHLYTAFSLYQRAKNIPKLIFTDKNKNTLDNICKYLAGEEGAFDLQKGLYFYGRIGSGKTDLCLVITQMINVLSRTYSNVPKYKILAYDALYNNIRESGNINSLTQNFSGNVYLDDLLYQDRNKCHVYGNEDYVADLVITQLYRLHKLNYRHILTSNYPFEVKSDPEAKSLKKVLHPTSFDRMKEMFNLVLWDGESLRK